MPEGLEHQGERQAVLGTARVGANEIPFLPGQGEAGMAFVIAEATAQAGVGGAFDRGHRAVLDSNPWSRVRPEASSKKRGLM